MSELTKGQIREKEGLSFNNPYVDNYSITCKYYILEGIKRDNTSYVMDDDILFRSLSFIDDIYEYRIFVHLYKQCHNAYQGLQHYIYISSSELANMFCISKKRVNNILSKLYSRKLIDKWKDGKSYKLSIQYKIKKWKI